MRGFSLGVIVLLVLGAACTAPNPPTPADPTPTPEVWCNPGCCFSINEPAQCTNWDGEVYNLPAYTEIILLYDVTATHQLVAPEGDYDDCWISKTKIPLDCQIER